VPPSILAWLLFVTNHAAQPDVAAHAKEIVAFLSTQKFAEVEAQFTDQMTAALPAGRLGATWTALLGQVAPSRAAVL
jgi:hypothetical protein